MKFVPVLLAYLVVYSLSSSATIRNVPAVYSTIQGALNACLPNDTVLVQPGNYNENLTWPSVNGIRLLSSAGTDSTIISANSNGRVLAIISALVDTATVISGFTLRDGYLGAGTGYGAGIYITNASARLENLKVMANRVFQPGGHGYGAGIHLDNSSTVIRNCTISGNSIDSASWCYGAGIYISSGAPVLTDVLINGNSANSSSWCYGVGLFARAGSVVTLQQVTVTGNYSGDNAIWYYGNGIYLGNVTASLVNVLVAANHSGAGGSFNYGGGIYCDGNTGVVTMMNVTVADNFKAGNGGITGSGLYVRDASAEVTNSIFYNPNSLAEAATSLNGTVFITYSDVRGNFTGTGNIDVVPGFVSSTDYHLSPLSPCAGTGTATGAPPVDRDSIPRPWPAGTLPDRGCYEVDQVNVGFEVATAADNFINIYPNPVISGEFLFLKNMSEQVVITDITGKKVVEVTQPNNISAISTAGWNPGWYLLHSQGRKTTKLGVVN